MKTLSIFSVVAMFIVATVTINAQNPSTAKATREDELMLQIVILKSQLAQVMGTAAKCEVEGSTSTKAAQAAQADAQALLTSLDARGLTIDAKNAIVPKSPTEPKK